MITYADMVKGIVRVFDYQYCDECGRDLDRHIIVPGPFGNPFAMCLERKRIMNCDCVCHDISGGSHSEKDCWCAS
jgi:hypothetical protein